MVLSEKPTAAKKIAEALDNNGTPQEVTKRGVSYYECKLDEEEIIVAYALGHLYELKQTEPGWKYPRFETEWLPKYEVVKKAKNTKPIIRLLKSIAKNVDQFIVATDYDIEGSLIGYLTLKYACQANPEVAHRMVFSSLTKAELLESYKNREKNLDFPMIEAGQVRHKVDWLYGINLTRALTLAIKNASGWFKVVSTGRVQGPTLSFVAKRDREINTFVPIPYWKIFSIATIGESEIELEYAEERIRKLAEAITIAKFLQGRDASVDSVKKKKTEQLSNPLFNLSSLQKECYRHFKYKPSRTLALAQALYLDALISYPRTNSEELPKSVNVKEILNNLAQQKNYTIPAKDLLERRRIKPVQGKKKDPAHPAIHPTGNKPTRRLTPSEKNVYDIIVRRFLASLDEPAKKESIRLDVSCDEHKFFARGLRVLEPGWMTIYGKYVSLNEKLLPPMDEGDLLLLKKVEAQEKRSQPPPRYNPSSLLRILEREGLGTKATRAGIVDSVRSRGYTLSDRFEMSTLGYALFETLQTYLPQMLSSEFTKQLEQDMELIQNETGDKDEVLATAKRDLLQILGEFQNKEKEIGQALVAGLQRYWKESEELGTCPKCEIGKLIIIKSPKTGKRFVGCTSYKEKRCDQTFPIPQKGRITPLDKMCPHCGFQMIKVVSGRRAWETCLNWTQCPGRQEDLKSLEERRLKRKQEKKRDE